MSGILMALVKSGLPASETHTLVTGASGVSPNRIRGYELASSLGSLTPTATTIGGATQIVGLYYQEGGNYYLEVNGGTDSGWSSMTIDGTKVFLRASANLYDPVTFTWLWTTSDTITSQAFGGNGTSHTVVFA